MAINTNQAALAIQKQLGLIKVSIPLPLWVDHINCFLFKGRNGWTIIDTGIYTSRTMKIWLAVFQKYNISPRDISQIIVTHNHIDHLGAAGALQKKTGVPVKMAEKEQEASFKIWLSKQFSSDSPYQYFGIPEPLKQQLAAEKWQQFCQWKSAIDDSESMAGKSSICLGNETYQILQFPGHAAKQLCFYHLKAKVLLSGDVLVPPYHLADANNSLALYFKTLQQLQAMEIDYIIPAHGKAFSRVNIRIKLIEKYRKNQLAMIKDYLGTPKTVFEVYSHFLSRGALADYYFGMGEIFHFLEYLCFTKEVEKEKNKKKILYRRRQVS